MTATVLLCGMPEEKEVLASALPGRLILSGTDKLNLPTLVPRECTRIVSIGLCGGLARLTNYDNDIGAIVLASALLDKHKDLDLPDSAWNTAAQAALPSSVAVTYYSSGLFDEADSAQQRADMFAKYGTMAIDDESRYAAALAASRAIAFNVLRSVSDDYSETLPLAATGAIMNKDGTANIGYLLWSLGQNNAPDSVSLFKVALDFKKSLDALEVAAKAVGGLLPA